ncbi:MAG: trehalose-6-phosphate synthase [Acidobacteriota bacterium]
MNAAELVHALRVQLGGTRLVVVANREPYIHVRRVERQRGLWAKLRGRSQSTSIECMRPASGLVTALDPVMRACGGTWVGHGSGSADRLVVDERDRVAVPPEQPAYTLRRVWLTSQEEEGYYYGLSNNALWPLCHIAYARPEFNESDWWEYVSVNRRFADAVLEELDGDRSPAIVFAQDYHFALLPRFIKEARPDVVVCHFWHIPWPNPEAFRICPWGSEILDGLLGSDLLGFHIQYHCNNFVETVDRTLEARVDREHFAVWRGGRPTYIKPFPISIDPALWEHPGGAAAAAEARALREQSGIGPRKIVLGVDRLDYTKGIPERFHAFGRLLENRPEWRGRVVFLQIGAPSRDHLSRYRVLSDEVDAIVRGINDRFGTPDWQPVIYRREHHDHAAVAGWYRAADVCIVSSLHDGMNLVAKEFIASRTDQRGVLVLSRFTGASRELDEALQVNPFAVDAFADTLHDALSMDEDQQARRMRALALRVGRHTVYDWAAAVLTAACRLAESQGAQA